MKKSDYKKLTSLGGALTACFVTMNNSAIADTVSYTNTFTISTSHTMNAVIGLGANASYADKASATLPLFNSSLGALNSATISATTVNPTFTGTLDAALLGLNVGFTQT